MRNQSIYFHRVFLLLFCLLEVAFITFERKTFGVYGSPLVIFVASLLIGLYPVWIIQKYRLAGKTLSLPEISWKPVSIRLVLLLIGLAAFGYWVFEYQLPVFQKYPLNRAFSDVIPQIQVLAERWLADEFPYQPIKWNYTLFCPYMPLHWMPYSLPIVWEIDLRWTSLIVFAVIYVIYLGWVSLQQKDVIRSLFIGAIPGLFLVAIILYYPAVVAFTAEFLLASYYILIGLLIISPSPYLRAIGLLLGLLSRYTLVFWIPLYLLMLFLYEDKRKAILTGGMALIGFLIFYVIPFLSKDWTIFQQGLEYHGRVLKGLWSPANWQQDYRPYVMIQGFGFAAFFYELPFEPKVNLKIIQFSQIVFSIGSTAVWGLWYRKLKDRIPLTIYLLLGLKVYFAILYSLMPNPYGYYFFLPVGITVMIVAWIWKADPELQTG